MITNITFPISKVYYGKKSQSNNSTAKICPENKAIADLESPKSFYNRQIINRSKISDVNFGFHFASIQGLICPCCGKLMYTHSQIQKLATALSAAKGQQISKILYPHIKHLHPVEKQVAEILMKEAVKDPDKNIKQIISFNNDNYLHNLEEKQLLVMNSIKEEAKNLQGPIKTAVLQKLAKIIQIIEKPEKDNLFKRKKAINTIDFFAKQHQALLNSKVWKKISSKILELPMSGKNFDAFIVKYTQDERNNFEIAERIFLSNQITKEHIFPALRKTKNVENGSNEIGNSLAMCLDCNGDRDITPYYIFVKKHPKMIKNLSTHMKQLQQHIIRKRDSFYYNYFLEAREAIRKQSTPPGGTTPKLDFDTSLIENFISQQIVELNELVEKYKATPNNQLHHH